MLTREQILQEITDEYDERAYDQLGLSRQTLWSNINENYYWKNLYKFFVDCNDVFTDNDLNTLYDCTDELILYEMVHEMMNNHIDVNPSDYETVMQVIKQYIKFKSRRD